MLHVRHEAPYRLSFDDAVDIWLRHWAGEFQHTIAAIYRVNPGRVNEVLKENRHIGAKDQASARLKNMKVWKCA